MNIIKKVEEILKKANIEEYHTEAKFIVEMVSNLTLEDIMLDKQPDNIDEIINCANKRAKEKIPVQYVVGYSYFMNTKYKVNSSALIPRDETEILVNKAVEILKTIKKETEILDIGVGTGCISIEIAKKINNAQILAIDINSDTLRLALENIQNNNLIRKILLRKSDLFSKIRENEKFDLIISNPPYIPLKEKNNLQYELRFEPDEALFADDELGINFYKKIIKNAPNFLNKHGFIAFEIGINQAPYICELLEEKFKNIEITPDLANIERVITAQLK
ncbi:peptide chain release factor N(5)-glutamine methyltransferase [bacterium]|nr:peptide chain release factor N(5)-glutamine methyltransferase [bacterium]